MENKIDKHIEKRLLSKSDAMKYLGVGERTFRALGIPFVQVLKTKKYKVESLENWINSQEEKPCQNLRKEKGRRSTGTTSQSEVIGFEAAQRQIALRQQSPSLPN